MCSEASLLQEAWSQFLLFLLLTVLISSNVFQLHQQPIGNITPYTCFGAACLLEGKNQGKSWEINEFIILELKIC